MLASNFRYVDEFLFILKERNKLHLLDEITLHGYTRRPEDNYGNYFRILQLAQSYDVRLQINQVELGCPSENQAYYALRNYDWTEMSQSKWLLRRLLGDLGHDIPSLYFTIIDMNYVRRYRREGKKIIELDESIRTVNKKGLLRANPDNTVAGKKQSYLAYQNVTSIFGHTLHRIPNYPYQSNVDSSLSLFAYRFNNFDYQVVSLWMDGSTPSDREDKIEANFEFENGEFDSPVYVDMRTGEVYEIPGAEWERDGSRYSFKNVPIYDSPILIAEKKLIRFTEN